MRIVTSTNHLSDQDLGLQGASTLTEVLKSNEVLRELHCDHNAISLTGFTDLISSLATNKTLLYLPSLEEGRNAAIKQTQEQIKLARTRTDGTLQHSPKISSVRRTFGSIGGSGDNNRTSPKVAAVPQWTEQDVQAALRLVREGWEGQVRRLDTYLERNWKIYHGVPLEQAEEELSEIPREAESHNPNGISTTNGNNLAAIFEKVAMETTPTMEKQSRLEYNDDESTTARKPASSRRPIFLPDLDFEEGRSLMQGNIFGIGHLGDGEVAGLASAVGKPTASEQDEENPQTPPGAVQRAQDDGDEAEEEEQEDMASTMPMKRLDSASTVRNSNASNASGLSIPLAEYQSRVLNLSPTKKGLC